MSLRVNLNTASLAAHRALSGTDNALGKSMERLSSGFRINGAGDDPAGLVISEKLRAQIGGIGQAIKNAGDATNMVKTAEGALTEVHRLLRSMRDLAVHAANAGANDSAAVAADQSQITNALASINKIADETMFGNKKLLDGSAGIKALVRTGDVVAGNFSYATTLADGDLIDLSVTATAEKASVTTDVNVAAGMGADGSVYINGVKVDYLDADTRAQAIDKFNAVSDETGVVASASGNFIKFESLEYGTTANVTITGAAADLHSAASVADIGANVKADVSVGGVAVSSAMNWASGTGTVLKDTLGNEIDLTVATATTVGGGLPQAYADVFQIELGTLTFQVGAYADQTRELNISSVKAADIGLGAVGTDALADISVLTADSATDAIEIIDKAISDISSLRANLGATQKNVFESSINSLTVAKENISASESTIRDADMASEMVEFTKLQILNQVGVAMLAQANQAPQNLLSLLR